MRHVLDRLRIDVRTLPEHLDIGIDSRPCFHAGVKLGLGSSAAATVATAAAFAELASAEYTLDPLFDIHRDLQGRSGSGLDVAACHRGGVIRFQSGEATALRLPRELHYLFVHVGWSTETADLVGRFNAWRGNGHPPELRRLMQLAEDVAEAGDAFLEPLAPYIEALEASIGQPTSASSPNRTDRPESWPVTMACSTSPAGREVATWGSHSPRTRRRLRRAWPAWR